MTSAARCCEALPAFAGMTAEEIAALVAPADFNRRRDDAGFLAVAPAKAGVHLDFDAEDQDQNGFQLSLE